MYSEEEIAAAKARVAEREEVTRNSTKTFSSWSPEKQAYYRKWKEDLLEWSKWYSSYRSKQ